MTAPGASIKQLIALATASVILVLLLGAVLSIWVFASAEAQLSRSLYSYEQLAIATRLETDASRALLAAAMRRDAPGESVPAALVVDEPAVSRALEALINRIREEIGSISNSEEQAEEAQEFVAAFAIRESYARLARTLAAAEEAGAVTGARGPAIDPQALAHFLDLDAQLGNVITGEREELAATLTALGDVRQRLQRYALLTAILAALGVGLAATLSYRSLMSPLAGLDYGSAQLAAGKVDYRLAVFGPREFRQLAGRLNDMASRLDAQRAALRDSNEQLEATVATRTAELADKAQRLQDIDDSRRLFFAKVGHELRTPLTVLLGEAELARQSTTATPDDYREALEHIAANGDHLKRRIDDLMAVARSADGQLSLRREPVELTDLARATVQGTMAFARSNDVRLLLRCSDTSLAASADPGWLRQALMALIDNAIKFSPADGSVELGLVREGDRACFSVCDDGPGVPEADLPKLVEPYYQSTAASPRAGTGLGLAVAHWVAQQHQGDLSARNRNGGGFAVALTIPLIDLP